MMESPGFEEQRQREKSPAQKIMMTIGLVLIITFLMVAYSIFNSGNIRAAAPPDIIKYEAAESIDEELESQAEKIAEAVAEEEDEEEDVSVQNNVGYTPPPIPEQRQTDHNARIMAANAGTALAGFTSGKAEAAGAISEEKKIELY